MRPLAGTILGLYLVLSKLVEILEEKDFQCIGRKLEDRRKRCVVGWSWSCHHEYWFGIGPGEFHRG